MFFNRKVFNARAIYIFIFGAFFLLLPFFLMRLSGSPSPTVTVKVVPLETYRRAVVSIPPIVAFDSDAYYRPILDYNIFRPLGWTPARPREPYRLIGTVLPRSVDSPAQAIIETTSDRRRHLVSIGDNLDVETRVISIEGKSVVLESVGKSRRLNLGGVF